MMHQKALLFDDQEIADAVMRAPTPREQKALGKQVRNFKEPIWDEYKLGIVWQGNFLLGEVLMSVRSMLALQHSQLQLF